MNPRHSSRLLGLAHLARARLEREATPTAAELERIKAEGNDVVVLPDGLLVIIKTVRSP